MKRRLFLIFGLFLLTSCPLPVVPCETGVAHVASQLSVARSLMANADVALLRSYPATSRALCMHDCCTGVYGSCSVASFARNATTRDNCRHFYCRPLHKCKYLPSSSTDTFTFSSDLPGHREGTATTPTPRQPSEDIAAEQFAPKTDNTTVKPRKGVDAPHPDLPHANMDTPHMGIPPPHFTVKPRKGVVMDTPPHAQPEGIPPPLPHANIDTPHMGNIEGIPPLPHSSVKPRKGVDPEGTPPSSADEVMKALQKVFADDSSNHSAEISAATSFTRLFASVATPVAGGSTSSATRQFVSAAVEERVPPTSTPAETSSATTRHSTSVGVNAGGHVVTIPVGTTERHRVSSDREKLVAKHGENGTFSEMSEGTHVAKHGEIGIFSEGSGVREKLVAKHGFSEGSHEKLVAKVDETVNDKLEETDRLYQSSVHLVLSLVFGLLVLFAVLGVVAKRVYDGWLRRDYYRMNYLIDGIYNGTD